MQFINIAIVILIVNFNFIGEEELFLGFLPVFNGTFKDFTVGWYGQVGKTLCLTLLINIFSPHASKLAFPVLKLFKRCMDRGCGCNVKKDPQYDQDHDVNTKLWMQSELNTLYTGDQISSHYVYAQNYTYLLCVMTYSVGLPILYPFACVFYMVLYWVYKFLLLKYYARTNKFN